jgi:pimeloyl-ACP methyl ester carboxylesterase
MLVPHVLVSTGDPMFLNFTQWPNVENGSHRPTHRLVLLHGMGGTGSLWRPLAATLEDQFDILSLDQRGHGKSRVPVTAGGREPARYTPLDYGRDVVETMENTAHHPAWLIGHSMGVRTACAAAYLKPEWVKGLCLIDLGFHGPAGGGLGDTLGSFVTQLPHHFENRETAREYIRKNCPDPAIGQYLMAVSVVDPETKVVSFPFDHQALVATIHAARDASVRGWVEALAQKGMPILALRGETSTVWSREDFEKERAHFSRFPSVKFVEMAGTGHGLPFEKRREFAELFSSWARSG